MLRKWCLPVVSASLLAGVLSAAAPTTTAGAAAAPAAGRTGGQVRTGRPALARLIRPGMHRVGPAGLSGGPRASSAQSTNWSGYAAAGGTYTKVSASWVEPKASCPSSGSQYASFWVGLDGYQSNTVEQTGSEVDCAGGQPQYYAWYEMYPNYPSNFTSKVRPGDHITGSVAYHGGGKYTLVLADVTRGWRHAINASLTGAANSSAEVIAEAPSAITGVLPLADFGTAHFTSAMVDGHTIGHFHPVRITMVNSSGQDEDRVSDLASGTRFSVTWLRTS